MAKMNIDDITLRANKINLEVLSTSYKFGDKIKVKCQYGHSNEVSLQSMEKSGGCTRCKTLKSYKEVLELAKTDSFSVLTNEDGYLGSKQKLLFLCPKNHSFSMDAHHFKRGQRCKTCKFIKLNADRKLNKEELEKTFLSEDYTVISGLDEYANEDSSLFLKCPNGHSYSSVVGNFRRGYRCKECHYEANKGENHVNWKGGISPIYEAFRGYIADWKKESLIKDSYRCTLSGLSDIEIHHLYSFNKIVKDFLRFYKMEDVNKLSDLSEAEGSDIRILFIEFHSRYGLGVCLEKNLHKHYHVLYGKLDNTIEQFEEFKMRYYSGEFTTYK